MGVFEHGDKRLFGIREHLPCGSDKGFVNFLCAALGLKVKEGDGIYFVAPKFNADGALRLGRKEVKNSAANGELAGTVNLASALIARPGKALRQLLDVGAVTPAKLNGVKFIGPRGNRVLERRLRRGDDYSGALVEHPPEHGKTLLLIFGGSALGAPKLEVPGRVKGDVFRPGELVKVLRKLRGGGFVRGD